MHVLKNYSVFGRIQVTKTDNARTAHSAYKQHSFRQWSQKIDTVVTSALNNRVSLVCLFLEEVGREKVGQLLLQSRILTALHVHLLCGRERVSAIYGSFHHLRIPHSADQHYGYP